MPEFWETAFHEKQRMWGDAPTPFALRARDLFVANGVRRVLVPGFGYGRNARPFLDAGMRVTGIEVSETAITLARTQLGPDVTIHHGSVAGMPFDDEMYDAVFCHGLLYLLDANGRAKMLRDCHDALAPGGLLVFTLVSKAAPMYGQGKRFGEDWYERLPNLPMYFFDAQSVAREFGPYGVVEVTPLDEPAHGGASMPFLYVVCRKS